MIRPFTAVWLTLVAGASTLLYAVSYEVEALEGELATLNGQIVAEQDTIRVLHAEWALLNQPERLRTLAEAYTDLAPMRPDQLAASLDAIPFPLPGQEYRIPAPEALVAYGAGAETMPLPQRRPSPIAQGAASLAGEFVVPAAATVGATPTQADTEARP